MKIIRKILFRVIVAVLVCFILSKFKLLGIMQVNALTRAEVSATQFCVYWRTPSSNPTCDGALNNGTYYGRPFQTYTYMGDTNFESVSFLLNINTNIRNKNSYWSGVFFTSAEVSNSTFPIRAYIDNGNNSFACSVESTLQDPEVGIGRGYLSTISCDNVVVLNETPRLFITGPFANYSSTYAINKWAAIYDNDNLVAQEQANQYLNDLKTLTNTTNSKLDSLISGILASNNTQTQIQNNTKETNDLIKDDSSISNDKITDITNIDTNTSNTPVSDFVTLPITLINKYKDGMNGTCSPISLGTMYNYTFTLPCINVSNYIGSNLWNLIDKMISFFLVYKIAMMCLKMFEDITSLKDPFDEAYSPKHADTGKHGEV